MGHAQVGKTSPGGLRNYTHRSITLKFLHRVLSFWPLTTRRGAFIFMLSTIYVAIGWASATIPPPAATQDSYSMAIRLLPYHVWGIGWIIVGVVGVVLPLFRKEDVGFLVTISYTSVWSAMAFGSTIFYGAERGWIGGLTWAALAVALNITAGLRDPQ